MGAVHRWYIREAVRVGCRLHPLARPAGGWKKYMTDDPDYSPEFQDEYQRLWHEAAARAVEAEDERVEWQNRCVAAEAERDAALAKVKQCEEAGVWNLARDLNAALAALRERAEHWEREAADGEAASESFRGVDTDAAVDLARAANRARSRAKELRDIISRAVLGGPE